MAPQVDASPKFMAPQAGSTGYPACAGAGRPYLTCSYLTPSCAPALVTQTGLTCRKIGGKLVPIASAKDGPERFVQCVRSLPACFPPIPSGFSRNCHDLVRPSISCACPQRTRIPRRARVSRAPAEEVAGFPPLPAHALAQGSGPHGAGFDADPCLPALASPDHHDAAGPRRVLTPQMRASVSPARPPLPKSRRRRSVAPPAQCLAAVDGRCRRAGDARESAIPRDAVRQTVRGQ